MWQTIAPCITSPSKSIVAQHTTEVSADPALAPLTKCASHHCPNLSSSAFDIYPSDRTSARGSGDDGGVSRVRSNFCVCGLRSTTPESEITSAAYQQMRDMKSELVFGKDSQDWFKSLVLVFISIGSEDERWNCSISQISHVPIQLQAFVASITVGRGSYSLEELAAAFLSVTHFPLGYLVECKLREDKAVLGDACVLMSAFLSKLVTNILASNSGVTNPREVPRHCWKYVFTMLAFCNQIAFLHPKSFKMIPQYWASNQGEQILRTIEIKFQCACHRQHSMKKQRQP